MSLFSKVPSQKLRDLSAILGDVYADCEADMKAAQFARTLSVMMRCELARRNNHEQDGASDTQT